MNKKIIIADQDEITVNSIYSMLKETGYEIIIADNGWHTLELVKRETPSIVIVNANLPLIDGFNVLKFIKAGKTFRNICVIIMIDDSYPDTSTINLILEGNQAYLHKPIKNSDLLRSIDESCKEFTSLL